MNTDREQIEKDVAEYEEIQRQMRGLIANGLQATRHFDSLWTDSEQIKNRYKGHIPSLTTGN